MLFFNRSFLFGVFVLFALSACGGGGGGSSDDSSNESSLSKGVFIDSAVEGLRYETATQSGFTDPDGTFFFQAGEIVSFYIGDILIGTSTGQAQITPIDLVPGATDATNSQVTNILRFVQSLDEDGNPDNGIVISSTVSLMASGQTLDFTLSIADFEVTANVVIDFITSEAVTSLISVADAIAHFQASIGVGGTYGSLAFSGADSSAVGTSFQPNTVTVVFGSLLSNIAWGQNLQIPVGSLLLTLSNDQIAGVGITTVGGSTAAGFTETYSYLLSCSPTPPPAACSGISVDIPGQSLTFNDVDLPIGGAVLGEPNLATSPLTVNGTLTWN